MIEMEIVDDFADARRLLPEWNALYARDGSATPFQAPAWVLACWEELARDRSPFLLVARREARLEGVAPLCRPSSAHLELLGGEVSDYLGIVAADESRAEVFASLFTFFEGETSLDRVVFTQLEPGMLSLPPEAGRWRVTRQAKDVCPVLRIPTGTPDPGAIVPSGFWKKIRAARRRIAREGHFEVVWVERSDLDRYLDALFRLHGDRWNARGMEGVLADDRVRAFHRRCGSELFEAGLLWPLELRLDGVTIAALHAFVRGRRVFYYASGFDPRYAALSPGTLAISALVERAIGLGMAEVDFLRGIEPYKYRWGAENRNTETVTLSRRGVREQTAREEAARRRFDGRDAGDRSGVRR